MKFKASLTRIPIASGARILPKLSCNILLADVCPRVASDSAVATAIQRKTMLFALCSWCSEVVECLSIKIIHQWMALVLYSIIVAFIRFVNVIALEI